MNANLMDEIGQQQKSLAELRQQVDAAVSERDHLQEHLHKVISSTVSERVWFYFLDRPMSLLEILLCHGVCGCGELLCCQMSTQWHCHHHVVGGSMYAKFLLVLYSITRPLNVV